ncbi:short-chain dehydrogenase/reductase SDR [Exidia glandulosa HHB12029]|uniref:Short-chain dehydrogenase/reductase SDR n=1 Tax=Exidia glandulosa HHB12029 TaxID=1314781 RepID=A0A165NA84_EXIGL|nr:short-chain dehydrogenase/reductase SDR [Exidia glandulosa HHB12029]
MATFVGKHVLVMGGTSGIGFAVAKASLVSNAARVIIASSTPEKVHAAVERLEGLKVAGTVCGKVANAKDEASIKELMDDVGELDHLVWTCGDAFGDPRAMFDVRFWGALSAARHVKLRDGGSITLTLGAGGLKPPKNWLHGAGVDGAVDALTRALAVDMAPVRVNAVCLGAVITEKWDKLPEQQRTTMLAQLAENTLVKHVGLPHEVAEAYLFLMKCGYITGKTIGVDGGLALV